MGRIALAALVLAGLSLPAGAAAALPQWTAKGAITRLNRHTITVGDTSCRITQGSPGRATLRMYFAGARVKIECAKGVLLDIDVLHPLPPIVPQQTTPSATAGSPSLVTSQTQTSPGASSATLAAVGSTLPVTALGDGSITAGSGRATLTCTLGPNSPDLGGLQVGDRITRMHCENGVLTALTRP